MTNTTNKKGFTLIELLVVIAIIGLLSSVVLASLNTARQKSRDARRKSDLVQMRTALEFYFDKYDAYPGDTFSNWEQPCNTTTNDLGKIVTEGFIPELPCDPTNSGSNRYNFDPNGTCSGGFCSNYCLYTPLEAGGYFGIQEGEPIQSCPGT